MEPGILENILIELRNINARLSSMGGIATGQVAAPAIHSAATQTYSPPPAQQYSPPPAMASPPAMTSPPAQTITADTITALITPHIGNEAVKKALGDTMRAMGIANLPDTQPHQFAELYQRFQGVIAQFTGGGAPSASSASII
jgi:hypothetical protein